MNNKDIKLTRVNNIRNLVMKTFKQYIQELYESVEDKLATISLKTKIPIEKLQAIFGGDPTSNKMYVNWLVKLYMNGNLRFPEDAERSQEVLSIFDKVKHNTQFKSQASSDIGKYKNIQELWDTIRKFQGVDPSREGVIELPKGATEIYNDGTYRIIKITTPEASVIMAKNSEWCVRQESWATKYLKGANLYLIQKTGYNYALISLYNNKQAGLLLMDYKDVEDLPPSDKMIQELHPIWITSGCIPHNVVFGFENTGYIFEYSKILFPGSFIDYFTEDTIITDLGPEQAYIMTNNLNLSNFLEIYSYSVEEASNDGQENVDRTYYIPVKITKEIITANNSHKDYVLVDDALYVHCDNGPAISRGNLKIWFNHGKLHRDNGPAIEFPMGSQWWKHGKLIKNEGNATYSGPTFNFSTGGWDDVRSDYVNDMFLRVTNQV